MFSRITSTLTSSSSSLARRITWATLPITSTTAPATSASASATASLLPPCLCSCSHVISSSLSSSSSFSSFSSSSRRSFSTSTDSSSSSSLTSQPRLITLNTIADNRGARTKRTRVGRGPGSGLGKTAGRGHKGTWARGSLSKPGFEGGQTPSHRTMPKRGFTNIFKTPPNIVNLNRLQDWIDQGRIRTDEPITMKTLWDSRCVTKIKYGVKILARGGEGILKQPVHIECTDVSELAKKIIDEAGGSVKLVYFNRVGLRAHLKPEKFLRLPPGESSIPPPKKRDHFARQGVKAIRNQQTAADIAMANIRAQAEADAKKGITQTSSTTPTVNEKENKKKEKKEKKDKKAAEAAAQA